MWELWGSHLITRDYDEETDKHTVRCNVDDCVFEVTRPKKSSAKRISEHLILAHYRDSRVQRYDSTKRARYDMSHALSVVADDVQASEGSPSPSLSTSLSARQSTSPARSLSCMSAATSSLLLPASPAFSLAAQLDEFKQAAATFFATSALPFKIAESIYFDKMLLAAGANPALTLNAKSVKRESHKQSAELRQAIIKRLQMPFKYVTIAADGWTNVRQDKVTNVVLLCDGQAYYWTSIVNTHGSDSIVWLYPRLQAVVNELHQLRIQVVGLVTDNAPNLEGVRREMLANHNVQSIPCAAHTIQMMVRDVLSQAKWIVGQFEEVVKAFREKDLRLKLKALTTLTVVSPNATRWSSQLASYIRLHRLSQHINSVARANADVANIQVTDLQWKALDELIVLLKPFQVATDIVQSTHASLADVFVALSGCIDLRYKAFSTPEFSNPSFKEAVGHILTNRYLRFINVGLVRLALKLSFRWESLQRKYKQLIPMDDDTDAEQEQMYRIAASLSDRLTSRATSPATRRADRYSTVGPSDRLSGWSPATSPANRASAASSFSRLSGRLSDSSRATLISVPSSMPSSPATSPATGLADAASQAEVKARLDRQWADFATTKGGFELLKREDVLTRPSVMRYWLQRADNDGTAELARVALAVLAINPSEASVERTFSHQGLLHSKLRSKLGDGLVAAQMMVRCNHHQLNVGGGSSADADWVTAADGDDSDDNSDVAAV